MSMQLYPLLDGEYDEVVESGYKAMKSWHKGKKQDKVGRRIPNYPLLIVIWVFRFLQLIVDFIYLLLWPMFFLLQIIQKYVFLQSEHEKRM